MLVRYRYYLKMLRYEQFLIPLALLPLFVVATLAVRDSRQNDALAAQTALTFSEAVLPLVAALVGSSMLLGDPLLELHYTMPRPLWRCQLERLVLLTAIMGLFYGVFWLITWGSGLVWPGYSGELAGGLVWLGPTLGWGGLALGLSAALRSVAAGGGLAAMLWLFTFFTHDTLLKTQWGRLVLPQLTIFSPDNPDWPANRLVLAVLGLFLGGVALAIMRRGEAFIGGEK